MDTPKLININTMPNQNLDFTSLSLIANIKFENPIIIIIKGNAL